MRSKSSIYKLEESYVKLKSKGTKIVDLQNKTKPKL